jgi:hypothetical protein
LHIVHQYALRYYVLKTTRKPKSLPFILVHRLLKVCVCVCVCAINTYNNIGTQSTTDAGSAALGEISHCKVWIKENKEFHNFIDRLMYTANTSLLVGSHSWGDQFKDAITLRANDGVCVDIYITM